MLLGLRLCIWHQKARPLAVRAFWGSQSDRWKVDPSRKISNGKSSAAMRAYETVCFFKKVLIATWDWLHLCLRSLSDQDTVCRSKRARKQCKRFKGCLGYREHLLQQTCRDDGYFLVSQSNLMNRCLPHRQHCLSCHAVMLWRVQICSWLQGKCRNGELCRFAHGSAEQRQSSQLVVENLVVGYC